MILVNSFLSIFSFADHIHRLALSFIQRAASIYFLYRNRMLETDRLEVMLNASSIHLDKICIFSLKTKAFYVLLTLVSLILH